MDIFSVPLISADTTDPQQIILLDYIVKAGAPSREIAASILNACQTPEYVVLALAMLPPDMRAEAFATLGLPYPYPEGQ